MTNIRNRSDDGYFAWLCRKVGVYYGGGHAGCEKLLWHLHSIRFKYSILNDVNRLRDGAYLREMCYDETGSDISEDDSWPVSVLEVLVAVCRRLCEEVFGDVDGRLTERWFWVLVRNLGLNVRSDKSDVYKKVDDWLERRFSFNGVGSPFPIKKPAIDQRKIEIWAQINSYSAEHPELERVCNEDFCQALTQPMR